MCKKIIHVHLNNLIICETCESSITITLNKLLQQSYCDYFKDNCTCYFSK